MTNSQVNQYYPQLASYSQQLLRRDSREHSAGRLEHTSPPFQRPVSIRNPEAGGDQVGGKLRELEGKIREQEVRLEAVERGSRNSGQLARAVEELMKKDHSEMEEKVASLGQMVSHLMAVKADRREE